MINTDCENFTNLNNLSKGYNKKGKVVENWTFNVFLAAGGIHSNSKDLNTYVKYFLENEKFFNNLSIPQYENKEKSISYLFHLKKLNNSDYAIYHNGNTDGFSSYIIFIPYLNIGVNVLSNSENLVNDLAIDILNLVIEYQIKQKTIRK